MLKLGLPILFLLCVIALAALSDRPLPRADLTYVERNEVTTLDPSSVSWNQDFRAARLVFEGLLTSDPFTRNFALKPAAAESLPEVSADGRTYRFRIRADAKWSNGQPLRARDFVFAWRRSLMPDSAADYSKLFQLIDGAERFAKDREAALKAFAKDRTIADRQARAAALHAQALKEFERVGLRALDDRTLEVRLVRPVPYFAELTAFPPFFPVYPPLVEAYEHLDPESGMVKPSGEWAKPPAIIGNGPYALRLWRFKRDMRFEKNPHYWNPGALNLDTIAVVNCEDGNQQILAFRTGAVDWTTDVLVPYRPEMIAQKAQFYREHAAELEPLRALGLDPIEIDRRLPSDPRNCIAGFPAFGTYFLNLNCRPQVNGVPNPLADRRVRKALALAIDKRAIVEELRRSGEPIASTLIPPGSIVGYRSPKGLGRDPEQARRLLAEAGFPAGQGLPAIELLFNRDAGHDLIAQEAARDWQRELGINVSLAQKEIKVFRDDLKNGNFAVSRASWFGDYGDPTTFLDTSRSDDQNNDRRFNSPLYDAMLDRAMDERDPVARFDILTEAERVLVEDELPFIPIFHYTIYQMFDPHHLTGVSSHPRQVQFVPRMDILGDGKGADKPLMLPPLAPTDTPTSGAGGGA